MGIDHDPKIEYGRGIPKDTEELAADQEKPRDELQGGEEYSEHREIEEPDDKDDEEETESEAKNFKKPV